MTAITAERVRQICREPHCRSKLPTPVTNDREAFCARGCHTRFYRSRCLACEQPKTGNRQLCNRRKCASDLRALRRHQILGRYHPSSAVESIQTSPDFVGAKTGLDHSRAWRQVAGPKLDRAALRLASLRPDREAAARVDRANRGFWRDANAKAEKATLIRRLGSPINLIGGYRFPDSLRIDLRPLVPPNAAGPQPVEKDPLAIPHFLLRTRPDSGEGAP
jgi:hypothetical protein